MAAKKHLGKGLDLLLTANSGKTVSEKSDALDQVYVQKLFSQALNEDEGGDSYEAYYLYRTLVDYVQARLSVADQIVCMLASQALNNAAIILHDAGQSRTAQALLQQACDICPDNAVARENLELTSQ